MDVAVYLQRLESSMSTFEGDDPLEQWDKFVQLLVRKLPPDSTSQLSPVLRRLVETFLEVEKYANDERYIGYCVKCASSSADPIALYSQFFSKGVGRHSAALYVSWAQTLEQRGMTEQAEAVFQTAFENQAQPKDSLLWEYRSFQSRSKPPLPESGARNPLQISNSANIMKTQGEASSQNKTSVDCQPSKAAERRLVTTISRSEYSGKLPPSSHDNLVSAYDTAALQCEGSELCFEEVRAQRFFQRLQHQQRQQQEQEEAKMQETIDHTQHDQKAWLNLKMSLDFIETKDSKSEQGAAPPPGPVGLPSPELQTPSHWITPALTPSEPEPDPPMDSSTTPTPSVSQYTPPLPASLTQHASLPPFHNAPAPTVNLPIHPSDLTAPMSHQVLPSHNAPFPIFSMSHNTPAPAFHISQSAPVSDHNTATLAVNLPNLSTSMSRQAPPALTHSYNAPVSSESLSHNAPAPDTYIYPNGFGSGPGTFCKVSSSSGDLSIHAPFLSAPMSHHAPATAANTSHHAPVTVASISQQESALFQAPPTDDHPLENHPRDNEDLLEQDNEANVSQGGTANLSRITPNSSLGYIQATPSRVLPSPTVNTREALDVIMDMFQAPTFFEEPFPSASEERNSDVIYTRHGASVKPASAAPFTIFQDEAENENKENPSAPSAVSDKINLIRAFAELPKLPKPNDTPTELVPDESTMWGAQFQAQTSLAACPNSTSDFAMLARFVSTPSTHKMPLSTTNAFFPEQEYSEGVEEDGFGRRFTKKLSPIMEQSPSEEKLNNTGVTHQTPGPGQGTIVGEGLAMNTQFMTTSCTTMVQPPPPAVLSFRDHTLGPNNTTAHRSTGPGWEVYTSPRPAPQHEPFTIMEDLDEPQPEPPQDVPMSPESPPQPDKFTVQSPDKSIHQGLHSFLTPHRVSHQHQDVPMSPQVDFVTDAYMMNPKNELTTRLDMSMNPKTPLRSRTGPAVSLVPDPWNDDLIAHLLASMDPPLMAHPRCVTWQCKLPNIAPKMTLSMGNASLRVDSMIGEGAFAKVYLASDPITCDKMVLKVQKPANAWEFYINTQLDARVPPSTRHFYSSFHSAHLFNNGSVLLGEMHNYGTLLNTVNMYRTVGDKVMPQPLVMYFTVCILHMIEQLHSVGIVHGDVKPDNFMLGERFLENRDLDSLDHGLVLIDLGQSIDMTLFPEGMAFTTKCLTSGFQCIEMQTGKPWNYHTDYFGVAGTVYCMLFGTYMQVLNDGGVWRTNGVFRRNPHSDLWQEFFHTLLNIPDCSRLPDLSALRHKLLSVLEQTYSSKLPSLKSRLVVLLLESSRKALRR